MSRASIVLLAVLWSVLVVAWSACGGEARAAAANAGGQTVPSPTQAPAGHRHPPPPPSRAQDAATFDWATVQDRTVVVAFFSQRMAGLGECLRCYQQLHEERHLGNLAVIAVCIDGRRRHDLDALLAAHELTLPVLIDDGSLQQRYQPTGMPHVFCFAEGGRFLGGLPGFPERGSPTPAALYTNLLRRSVGLEFALDNDPLTLPLPRMPEFEVAGTGVGSSSLQGAPYVLTFVAAGCDRCKAQLELFAALHREFGAAAPPFVVVLVDEDGDPEQLRRERGLPFAVHGDRGGALRRQLRYRGLVPDTFVVDAAGRIRFRHTTYDEEQPALYRMELRMLLGRPNPPILKANGPSGVRRCMVCHERQYFDWLASGHAHAMRSLQAIGKAEDGKCVRCHVVGWGAPGGYDADGGARADLLASVQCETCHQPGGPHAVAADGTPVPRTPITAATCTGCHDEEHSLGFDFPRFVDLVRHRSDLLTAGPAQQERLAAARQAQRQQLLEPDGAYAGAAACRQCHAEQYARWAGSAHARAAASLADRGGDAACTRCHVTGVERSWAPGATAALHDPVAGGVQCESCHGPGQRHVASGGARAAIVGLGARCEECVIRQICTTCHDRANDPAFDLRTDLPPMQSLCRPTSAGGTAADSTGRR
ncbi:MAG: multiheme c-type cytochrome [Planctomycetota bacterium]